MSVTSNQILRAYSHEAEPLKPLYLEAGEFVGRITAEDTLSVVNGYVANVKYVAPPRVDVSETL